MAVGQTGDPGAAVAWAAEVEYNHVRVLAPILPRPMLESIAKGKVPWPKLVTPINVQVQADQNSKQARKHKDYDSLLKIIACAFQTTLQTPWSHFFLS